MATRTYQVVDDAGDVVVAEDGSLVVVEETWSWSKVARAVTTFVQSARAVTSFTKENIPTTVWEKNEVTN